MKFNELARFWRLLAAAALLAGIAAGAGAEEWAIDSESLHVRSLIGEVKVHPASGSDFTVKANVRGEDAGDDLIRFDLEEGRDAELTVEFPVDEYDKFHYPDAHGTTRFMDWDHHGDDGFLSKLFRLARGERITISEDRGDVEVWCDLEIGVPEGKVLRVDVGVGDMNAEGVRGDAFLSSNAGWVNVENCRGRITGDTGSGHVTFVDVTGEVHMDTGSGHINGEKLGGDIVSADTGSGHIALSDVECDELSLDTGSGNVEVDRVTADDISVDTGSGGVDLVGVTGRLINIDTGSGRVEIDLLATPRGRLMVDTGSGGIRVHLPSDPDVEVHAETGSGHVSYDLSKGAKRLREDEDDDEIYFEVGSGDMQIDLETGSGSIRIVES